MTLKFVVDQQMHGNTMQNVFHFREEANVTQSERNLIAQGIVNAWQTHLVPELSDTWSLTNILFYDTNWLPGTPGIPCVFTPTPLVGGTDAAAGANQLSVLTRWVCEQGPPHRGRSYLGGFRENAMGNDGMYEPSIVAAVGNWAQAMLNITAGGGTTAQLVIISNNSDLVPAGTIANVVSGLAINTPTTQARRRIGRGS